LSECIFCQILSGEIPAHVLYEDESAVALLDAFPMVEGHALVVPRRHHRLLQDMPAEEAAALFRAVHAVAGRLQAALQAPALNVGLNNGAAAGQAVPHVHVHLIPRFEGDGGASLHAIVRRDDQRPVAEVFEQLKGAF
jgi:histidine triad (HIT) family protein